MPKDAPSMQDPGWTDYCIKTYFQPEELDGGLPRTTALRRVVEVVLGPIIDMEVTVTGSPSPENDYSASVACRIGIASRVHDRDVYFADAADVTSENLPDQKFARFPTATAATRAEGRALRKALKLNKCAAEEMTDLPVVERPAKTGPLIEPYQVNGILKNCRDMKLDVMKFINQHGSNYGAVDEMSKDSGRKALKILGEYFQDSSKIPRELLLDATDK